MILDDPDEDYTPCKESIIFLIILFVIAIGGYYLTELFI